MSLWQQKWAPRKQQPRDKRYNTNKKNKENKMQDHNRGQSEPEYVVLDNTGNYIFVRGEENLTNTIHSILTKNDYTLKIYKRIKEDSLKPISFENTAKQVEQTKATEGPYSETIEKILSAITELESEDIFPTVCNLAKKVDISKQWVHQILKGHDQLHRLQKFRKAEFYKSIIDSILKYDTKRMTLEQIKNLPIDGLDTLTNLRPLLVKYNVPHSYTVRDYLAEIDPQQYTTKELHTMIGGSFRGLLNILYADRIQFKGKRYRTPNLTKDDIKQ